MRPVKETTVRSFDMTKEFKETAHLKTDINKHGENYERDFRTKELHEPKHYAGGDGLYCETEEKKLAVHEIKELARRTYQELHGEQGLEGFPESASFIFGYIKGYQKAQEEI